MKPIRKTYTHAGMTVVWQPALCIHSRNCFHGLPAVFDPNRRPWVNPTAAEAQAIIDQVAKCPSGALSIARDSPEAVSEQATGPQVTIQVLPDGPLLVTGELTLKLADGSTAPRTGSTALCRCGASSNKPFCDGSHQKIGFTDK